MKQTLLAFILGLLFFLPVHAQEDSLQATRYVSESKDFDGI